MIESNLVVGERVFGGSGDDSDNAGIGVGVDIVQEDLPLVHALFQLNIAEYRLRTRTTAQKTI